MDISRRDMLKGAAALTAGAAGATILGGVASAVAAETGSGSASAASASGSASASASASTSASGSASASVADSAAAASGAGWDQEADVVIVGAGMGGLATGVHALEDGIKNVTIVEISKWIGGGSAYSVGCIHMGTTAGTTDESFDAATGYQNMGALAHKCFLGGEPNMEWLRGLGLPIAVKGIDDPPTEGIEARLTEMSGDTPRAWMVDADGDPAYSGAAHYFFDQFGALFESMGGTLIKETCVREIASDGNGTITGVICTAKDGSTLKIKASYVVLACGGWQNDEEMRQRHLGIESFQTTVLGTPYNTGAGIKLASKFGASLQGDFTRWSGVYYAAPPAKNWCEDVEAYEANDFTSDPGGKYYLFDSAIESIPSSGIIVDWRGERYVDEGAWGPDHCELTRAKRGTYFMIADSVGYEGWLAGSTFSRTAPTVQDKIDIITSDDIGGVIYSADTLEDLADQMNATGIANHAISKGGLVRTVEEYNAAIEAGTAADLPIARTVTDSTPGITTPPFYAMPLRTCIYVNFGGLAVNEDAQVLGPSRKPIPGLYATCPCAGGFFYESYTGSISGAAVTGGWAAAHIAAQMGL